MALSLTSRAMLKAGDNYIDGTRYYFNNDPNVRIFIPDEPFFSLIKGVVLQGKGLLESYTKAGELYSPYGNWKLEYLYPNPILAMPIKFFIFDVTDLVNGQPVSRPYADGVWIHEQASKILEMYFLGPLSYPNYDPRTATWGRLELEPGTVLPTQEEQSCIKNAVKYSMSITEAFAKCNCSEILPTAYLAGIENLIKTTNFTLFYIYMIAITKSATLPPPILPQPDEDGKLPDEKNYNLYIGLAIAAIFLLKGD
jgi:hypothetical protein